MIRRSIGTSVVGLLLVLAGLAAAPAAEAVTAGVQVFALARPDGKHGLQYLSTATSGGTVSYVDVTLPAGTRGSITSPNGSIRTVSPGVLRWKPSSKLTVAVGYRFNVTMRGFVLPSGLGPWGLRFTARSTSGVTLSSGTGYTAAVSVTGTSTVPGTTTTLRYLTKVTRSGTLASVRLYLPASATGSLSTANGSLVRSGSYVTWTPKAPLAVSVGTQLSIPVYNVKLSVYGSINVLAMTARKADGTILANGSGRLPLIAPPASMAPVPVTPIDQPASPCPSAWDSIATENAKPGTGSWVIPTSMNGKMSAYLTQVSATCGQSVDLKVDSGADVTVTAYRMGYYQGLGAREVWTQTQVGTVKQPAPILGGTKDGHNLYSVSAANWSTTLTIPITPDWAPGVYLIRVDDGTTATYAPLTVRDDSGTKHDVLLQQATTTWSAYNNFGGAGFYSTTNPSARLSFDRPYTEGQGSGQFLTLEQGMVFWLESQGVDVTYWTDNDMDEFGGQIASRATNLMMPAHDEYYSTGMRAALSQTIKSGVNVASMGANTVYRKIAFTSSSRRAWDADRWTAGENSTTWKWVGDAYASQPLLGAEYQCPLNGSTMTTGSSWLFNGVTPGTTLPGFIAGEIDYMEPGRYQQPGIATLFAGQGLCRGTRGTKPVTVTAFTAPSGSRVFNASVFSFSCYLVGRCPSTWTVPSPSATSRTAVQTMMTNVLTWISPNDPIERTTPKMPAARVMAPSMPLQANP